MVEYLDYAKSVLATSKDGKQITRKPIDKYPEYGTRTLAELPEWFTDFVPRRQGP